MIEFQFLLTEIIKHGIEDDSGKIDGVVTNNSVITESNTTQDKPEDIEIIVSIHEDDNANQIDDATDEKTSKNKEAESSSSSSSSSSNSSNSSNYSFIHEVNTEYSKILRFYLTASAS